jgi:hypothetical protein
MLNTGREWIIPSIVPQNISNNQNESQYEPSSPRICLYSSVERLFWGDDKPHDTREYGYRYTNKAHRNQITTVGLSCELQYRTTKSRVAVSTIQ